MNNKIINKAIQILSQDKLLKKIVDDYPTPKFEINNNYFDALSKSIIYQQLSGKVAKIIYNRFLKKFNHQNPNPSDFLDIAESELKEIGLSWQKIKYIKNLSNFFIENKNVLDFNNLSDKEIYNELIKIKGIGQWTIDMFMMFTLFRTDILPIGDLGIKKAFKKLYHLDELPTSNFMNEKSEKWKPYRTIACCYLWMTVDDGDVW